MFLNAYAMIEPEEVTVRLSGEGKGRLRVIGLGKELSLYVESLALVDALQVALDAIRMDLRPEAAATVWPQARMFELPEVMPLLVSTDG